MTQVRAVYLPLCGRHAVSTSTSALAFLWHTVGLSSPAHLKISTVTGLPLADGMWAEVTGLRQKLYEPVWFFLQRLAPLCRGSRWWVPEGARPPAHPRRHVYGWQIPCSAFKPRRLFVITAQASLSWTMKLRARVSKNGHLMCSYDSGLLHPAVSYRPLIKGWPSILSIGTP